MATSLSQTYPAPYQSVFDAAVRALPPLNMTVNSADPGQGVIDASAGVSLASWGENVVVRVAATGDAQTTVTVESAAKFGLNWGKNKRNAQKILDAVASQLPA